MRMPANNGKEKQALTKELLCPNVCNVTENFSYTQSYMFSKKVKVVTKKIYTFVTQINHELYLDRKWH